MAAGFSSLAMIQARLPIRPRASTMSSGRCTKDRATQSTPSDRPNSRSARSLGVSGEIGRMTPGTLTPLRSDSGPPTSTVVSAKSGPWRSTRRRSLPSSSSRSVPSSRAAKISGCGRLARAASPSAGSRSRRKDWPAARMALPPAIRPTRSFGPCRSIRMPMGWPSSCSTWRMRRWRSAWSSCEPWLKFRRNTLAPARARARICSRVELAGPRVARMRARRSAFMIGLPRRGGRRRPGRRRRRGPPGRPARPARRTRRPRR
ncbi:hypothetical protein CDEN61S_01842 [Castellaniella denitrificans]